VNLSSCILWKVNRIQKNGYTCDNCNQKLDLKKSVIKHLKQEHSELKIICSVENCNRSYKTLKCFSKHLKHDHNIDIIIESLSFNTIEVYPDLLKNLQIHNNQ